MMEIVRKPAACLIAAVASGCMGQSMPDVGKLTQPTSEAFATMTAWRPWRAAEPEGVGVSVAPVEVVPLSPPPGATPVVPPAATVAPARPAPVQPLRAAPRPARIVPASVSPASVAAPARVTCTTSTSPEGRVRTQCVPID